MTIFPLIERDLRVALRNKSFRKSRFRHAAISVAAAALCLIIFGSTHSGDVAKGMHLSLFAYGLDVAVLGTLELTAGMFAQERQNNTFGLLYLAGVSPVDLFGGKVLGAFLVPSTHLLAIAPALAIPFLTGGISISLFLATVFCLPVILVFTLAMVCLASALWTEESTARVGAMAGAFTVCAAPLAVFQICTLLAHPISNSWRVVSPAWGPWLVITHLPTGTASEFWFSSAASVIWSGLFFGLASVALRRSCKRELSGTEISASRIFSWIPTRPQNYEHWLQINPYTWLSLRNNEPVRLAWVILALIVTVAAIGCWGMPTGWIRVWHLLILVVLLNFAMRWVVAYAAAKRASDERRSGALELVLTTPLDVREIVNGHMLALDKQFRPVFRMTFFVSLAIVLGGFLTRTSWQWKAVTDYLIFWTFLLIWPWTCAWPRTYKNSLKPMWAGFNTGLPALAASKSTGMTGSWVSCYAWWNMLVFFKNFPSGGDFEFYFLISIGTCLIIGTIISIFTNKPTDNIETMMLSEFRLIAAEPMPDPKDPRLKKWNINERLYRPHPFPPPGIAHEPLPYL